MGGIVITGSGGQLGRALAVRLSARSPVLLGHGDLDLGDFAAVERMIAALDPEVVINAAAFNHVDDAETRADDAFRANALGPWALARATARRGALLVHFSTDYVFEGEARAPYTEDDPPAPLGVYGASKLAGERLAAANPRSMVLRTSALYGEVGGGKGRNFVDTMLRLGKERRAIRVVDDQRISPTSADDLADKTIELVLRWVTARADDILGLYHVTNAGDCSWFELATETLRVAGIDAAIEPISTTEYGARAPRPAYSVLARRHLERLGLDDLRPWQDALRDHLTKRLTQPSAPLNRRSGT
jgi:dTDP-4-dehydrorhamnose reductase